MKKRILFTSFFTVLVCLCLIAGSTFALFTSESNVDISVSSGKVEINSVVQNLTLYSMNNVVSPNFENGGTAVYENGVLTLDKVTPGDKVEFEIKVTNSSNIDIQYKINWSIKGKLSEVLVVKANNKALENLAWSKWAADAEKEIIIPVVVELPVEVGNDYQNETCNIVFAVEAVQGNAAGAAVVSSLDDIFAAIKDPSVNEIIFASDVDVQTPHTPNYSIILRKENVVFDLNGKTLSNALNPDGSGVNSIFAVASGTLTITGNGVLDNSDENSDDNNTIVYALGGNVIIENGTFLAGGGSTNYNNAVWAGTGGSITINDGYFYSSDENAKEPTELLYVSRTGTITINGGFFECEGSASRMLNVEDSGSTCCFYVNGGTFVNFDPSNPEQHQDKSRIIIGEDCVVVAETQENGDIWYTVVKQ